MSGFQAVGDSEVDAAIKIEDDDTVDVKASTVVDVKANNVIDADTPFDIEAELATLLGDDPILPYVGNSVSVNVSLWQERIRGFRNMAYALKTGKPVDPDQFKKVVGYLNALHNLENLHPLLKSEGKIDRVLEVIFNPIYNFPLQYQRIAKIIYDNLEAANWGEEDEEPEDDADSRNAPKRSLSASSTRTASDFPDSNDPIYGDGKIMDHILHTKGPNMVTYTINPTFKSRNAKIFGHNGLQVGKCWPMQLALLRDGAHGSKGGGIAGTISQGAFSIVVSGMYAGLDEDQGETLWYCAPNSLETTSKHPQPSHGTTALEKSLKNRSPVRVFRSSQAQWKNAPAFGIRYDGLYTIVSKELSRNNKGGIFKKFKLERNTGQDAINIYLPSKDMISLFKRVKDGYSRRR